MDNVIDKMAQLSNMLMVPNFGIGMDQLHREDGPASNMLMVPNLGITMIKKLIANPTKSFCGWSN
jgi:hypothetical protein